ncbi:hypothetical protein EYB26_005304 [Talaromyces marneffei]|uniref:uncharacterized protein n=1 Tax=Talaromyces marneffei TaxID=37727 RepID=UPI0012A8AC97|nr:uncharacterized protein EYB26_005304 [Talaromyces marneffei]QGA17629.1 hypothetical protein EYB26_005304 [Talaromyces marneffei]
MPVEIQGFLKYQLNKWIYQPPVDLQEYQLIPLDIQWSSVEIYGIDGLLWTQSYPTKQVQNVAGRFLHNGQEYKWIVPGHSLTQSIGNTMPEDQGIPDGVKIPGGVQEHDGLSSALTEIHQEDLNRMSFEIRRPTAQFSVAITVQQIARCILYGQLLVRDK